MASECDSLRRFPLHLASAEGHTQIVKALLIQDKDVCLARDQDGRTPLHLAAMRGRVEAIQELVCASSESISVLLDGDRVLHLCVKYNHLDALKLLVPMLNDDFINLRNQDGNTILHLAAMLNQLETIRYLLSLPEVKERLNNLNGMGLTALDLLEQCPRDFKSLEIRGVLMEAGAERAVNLNSNLSPQPTSAIISIAPETAVNSTKRSEAKSWFGKCMKHLQYDVEESRGALMVVATVIATVTFQAAMNPPGGVWQQNFANNSGGPKCSDTNICEAGTAVLAYAYPEAYIYYSTFNGIAFFASLSVIALVWVDFLFGISCAFP
ncbi:hypothetical protein P3X46_001578 [Hevea brasiliensis]|uniref:PGG domain-containing protein n=1 Tax=Hevea brasiliensis TaxID=3981 RepID=A0ABQ9NF46_HEVBR|nr:hypothetical protein P3X46_001578 [Hevea brasiliensis]